MNADCWKLPNGVIATEITRKRVFGITFVKTMFIGAYDRYIEYKWLPLFLLRKEEPRYNGARGGRA